MSNKSKSVGLGKIPIGEIPDGTYDKHMKTYQKLIRLFSNREISCQELNALTFTLDKMYNMARQNDNIEKRLDKLEEIAGFKDKTFREKSSAAYKTVSA